MDKNENKFIELLDSPEKLEQLYRTKPVKFQKWFNDAVIKCPDSEVIRVWRARLNYSYSISSSEGNTRKSNLIYIVILSVFSGLLVKLPEFIKIEENWYYSRFTPIIIIAAITLYFCQKIESSRIKFILFGAFVGCTVIAFIYPHDTESASLVMSKIHMPLVLLSLLSLAFMAQEWKRADARLRYIRYLGEVTIYAILILLGGVVLTFLTLGLFNLVDLSIENWYLKYVVVFGLVASPIVATYLYDSMPGRDNKLATIISNIFSPLFLVTVSAYLVAVLYQGKSPYTDRDFLIMFNGLLVVVWVITVFSISGKSSINTSKLADVINVSLVSVTLMINTIALSAIIFRLTEYGVTPNRIVVTGTNILIFVHLVLILREYIKYIKNHGDPGSLKNTVASYLPIYSGWSLFIVVALPLLFSFE